MEVDDDMDVVPINQEDCWEVISAYFEEKGLVRQQVRAAALQATGQLRAPVHAP